MEEIATQNLKHETKGEQLLFQIDSQRFDQMICCLIPSTISADLLGALTWYPVNCTTFVDNSQFDPILSNLEDRDASNSSKSSIQHLNSRKTKQKFYGIKIESKKEAYLKIRKRNKESAKRYRENKRISHQKSISELELLEQKNIDLKAKVVTLTDQIRNLRTFFRNQSKIENNENDM